LETLGISLAIYGYKLQCNGNYVILILYFCVSQGALEHFLNFTFKFSKMYQRREMLFNRVLDLLSSFDGKGFADI
jgi:hypothetical protein